MINMAWSCNECGNLDKTKRKVHNGYIYGCKGRKCGYICGWISKDTELKTMGCSDFTKEQQTEQIKMF